MTIVIAGGGVAGLSVAWQLARKGARVTVVESAAIASGASGVATAYLEPRLGTGSLRQLEWESVRRWPSFVTDLERESGQSCGYRRDGQLRIAWPEDEARILQDLQKRLELGWQARWLNAGETRRLEPALSRRITGSVLLPQVHWLNGTGLCLALRVAIERSGGTVLEGTSITTIIAEDGSLVAMETVEGVLRADAAILCNGAGASEISGLPGDIPRSRVTKGTALFYPANKPLLTRMIRHPAISLCPRSGGIIAGSSRERGATSLTPDPAIVAELHERACRAVPALGHGPPPEPRSGMRALVGDGLLRLGQSREIAGLYYSLSQAGAGFLRAAVIAGELADFVLDNTSECPFIDPYLQR